MLIPSKMALSDILQSKIMSFHASKLKILVFHVHSFVSDTSREIDDLGQLAFPLQIHCGVYENINWI